MVHKLGIKSFGKLRVSILVLLFSTLLFIPAQAQTNILINGTQYFDTWDGRRIPTTDFNVSNNNSRYLLTQDASFYYAQKGIDSLIFTKPFANYVFGRDSISFSFTVTPTQLNSRSVKQGTNWYIDLPDALTRTEFIWDDKKPVVINSTGYVLNSSHFWFTNIGGDLRFWYDQVARDFGIGSVTITFQFNSYQVNGSTTPAWANSSGDNTNITSPNDNNIVISKNDAVNEFFNRLNGNVANGWTASDNPSFQIEGNRLNASYVGVNYPTLIKSYVASGLTNYSIILNASTNSHNRYFTIYGTENNKEFVFYFTEGGAPQYLTSSAYVTCSAFSPYQANRGYYLTISYNQTSGNASYFIDTTLCGTSTGYSSTTQNRIEIMVGAVAGTTFWDDFRIWNSTAGNRTIWNNFGAGRQAAQYVINATGNYSVYERSNATGSFALVGTYTTTDLSLWNNQTITPLTKYQFPDLLVQLLGNTTASPQLAQITISDEAVSGGDTTPPTYSSASNNQTVAGQPTLFSIQYNDNTALHPNGQHTFSTNNSGAWVNDTAVNWSATPQWANVTKTLNSTVGAVIGYRWYGFDNASNWNNTPIYTLTTTSAPLTEFMPPVPISCSAVTGNFFVNSSCQVGAGNITTGMNKSVLDIGWNNNTNFFYNQTGMSAHANSNVSFRAFNSSGNGTLNLTEVWVNTTIPNNAISISNVSSSYSIVEGQQLYIDANYADADSDTGTFARNFTQGTFNTSTGVLTWNTVDGDQGTYYWQINVTDGYGSTSIANFTVTVSDSTPTSISNLQNNTGNFYINWSWNAGTNLNDYDVWVNGSDLGADTTNLFYNGTYSAHAQRIISVRSHNHTLNSYSGWTNQTTTIPNNIPVQSAIGNKNINEGQLLAFQISSTDADSDALTYGTNATKGTLNSTGYYSWTPTYTDSGTYIWYFNTTDNYSAVVSETITVTVANIPLTLTISPLAPTTTQGQSQQFTATPNRTANITWYLNSSVVQTNNSVTIAYYTNLSGIVGYWNITAVATDGIDTISNQSNWTVNSVLYAPNITSWGNSNTSNSSLSLTVSRNTNITFNITSNQSLTSCTWTGATQINCSGTTSFAFKNFTTTGAGQTVSVYGTNANGSTQTITWTVTVTALGGYTLTVNIQNVLGLNLQNAGVNFNGGNKLTDVNGNVQFTNVLEGNYTILARAINYRNSTNSTSINSDTVINFTMDERKAGSVATPGFNAGFALVAMVIVIMFRKQNAYK